MKVENAAFINLTNTKNDEEHELISYDLLFYATSKFTKFFIDAFSKTYPTIKTLNVTTDYNKLKDED